MLLQKCWNSTGSAAGRYWAVLLVAAVSLFGFEASCFGQQSVARAKLFELKDLNKDGYIDADELSAGALGKMRVASDEEFAKRDTNGDQKLTLEEFLIRVAMSAEARSEQTILVFESQDRNKDGELSLDEFAPNLDGKQLEYKTNWFEAIDKDSSGGLSLDEFSDKQDALEIPKIAFESLDKDFDGELTLEEFIGHKATKDWVNDRTKKFELYDKDRDSRLSFGEFSHVPNDKARQREITQLPPEEQRYARLDTNNDGVVSSEELAVGAERDFSRMDSNSDGKLTVDEYIAKVRGKPVEKNKRLYFSRLDKDKDGAISLDEFVQNSSKTLQNRKIAALPKEERAYALVDVDKDGRVSLAEFMKRETRGRSSPEQQKRLFQTVDANGDQFLSLNEYFLLDSDRPDVLFAKRDFNGDGLVDFAEFELGSQEGNARTLFAAHDANGDSTLSLEEFTDAVNSERSAARKKWLKEFAMSPMNWLTILIVVVDLLLVYWMGRSLYRRFRMRKSTILQS